MTPSSLGQMDGPFGGGMERARPGLVAGLIADEAEAAAAVASVAVVAQQPGRQAGILGQDDGQLARHPLTAMSARSELIIWPDDADKG